MRPLVLLQNSITCGLVTTVASNIAPGQYDTCASLSSGGVECWGSNQYGQLGINAAGQIVGGYLGKDDVFHGYLRGREDE